MSWSGGSYTKGNAGTGGWTGDASLGIGIEASRHDTQDDDFATGINQCLNKDGSNSCTGDLNLGGNKPTNIAAGTAAAPALCVGGDVNTGVFGPAADTWAVATNGTEKLRVDSSGKVGIGNSSPTAALDLQTGETDGFFSSAYRTDANGAYWYIRKSRNGSLGGNTIVQNGDAIGAIFFQGANGTGYTNAAAIIAEVDGTPGASNDMPGRLRFSTTADGSGALTERMRITAAGVIGIGMAGYSNIKHTVRGIDTGSSNWTYYAEDSSATGLFGVRNDGAFNVGLGASSPNNLTTANAANVNIAADGFLRRSTSSLRYKTDVQDYTRGLDAINALRPVFYKGKNDGDKQFAGLIAEEVHEAGLSEFVAYNEQDEPDALHYGNMVALAFKAIQELNVKVEALQARVTELEGA